MKVPSRPILVSVAYAHSTTAMFLSYYPFSLLQTLTIILGLYALRYSYWQLTTGSRQRRFAASRGCRPVPKWNTWDPFFGIDFLFDSYRTLKSHTNLEWTQRRFEEAGVKTVKAKLLGSTWVDFLKIKAVERNCPKFSKNDFLCVHSQDKAYFVVGAYSFLSASP